MSKTARTVFIFGFYLYAVGITLLAAPNLLLGISGLPETSEVWIRVVGMLSLLIGFYYVQSARLGLTMFFPLTVYARSMVFFFFLGFVLLGWAGTPLLLFGLVDLLGAGWTWMSIRGERN